MQDIPSRITATCMLYVIEKSKRMLFIRYPCLLVQFVKSEVECLFHVFLPVLVGELDVSAPCHNGHKFASHALCLK